MLTDGEAKLQVCVYMCVEMLVCVPFQMSCCVERVLLLHYCQSVHVHMLKKGRG